MINSVQYRNPLDELECRDGESCFQLSGGLEVVGTAGEYQQ